MNVLLRNALALAGMAVATQAIAQGSFYEREGFVGESFTTEKPIDDFGHYGFNDRASSAVVVGNRREVCEGFRCALPAQCMIADSARLSAPTHRIAM